MYVMNKVVLTKNRHLKKKQTEQNKRNCLKLKVAFFQKERIRFSNLQISKIKIFQKNYPELEI